MKALVFSRHPGQPVTHPALFSLIPDSAVTPSGMPVFLPPFESSWELAIGPAYRIGRLGKNIAPKFAMRYIDGMTLGAWAVPVDLLKELQDNGQPIGLLSTFDGALTLGEWQEPLHDMLLTMSIRQTHANWTPDEIRLGEALQAASRYVTLKTGDVIIPMLSPVHHPIVPDDIIEGSMGGKEVIRVKIK
ncbi:MAG: fumarylacetoacetate hydrolase family protein [Candidatus Amulumruptor sp.]